MTQRHGLFAFTLRAALLPAACLLLALPAAAGNPRMGKDVIAHVNGVALTEASLQQALETLRARGVADTPELREAIKQQAIARELFLQAARKQGLQKDAGVREAVRRAEEEAMIQAYLRSSVRPAPVTDTDVRRAYDGIVATLGEREYKASLIQTASRDQAQALLKRLQGGEAFAALAKAHSTASSAAQGGALDWVSFKLPPAEGKTQGWPLPLARALSALQAGQITPEPVEHQGSWHLLRLEEARMVHVPKYEEAQAALRARAEQQALQQAAAEVVLKLLSASKVELPGARP
jgi:parvulin-like peptidyl-prolyl isomerase